MAYFKSYNDFINKEHEVTASIGKIYGKRAKETDGSLKSIPGSEDVYITFDYCPGNKLNQLVIDLLKKEKIPCSLFLSSKSIKDDSDFENKISGINYSIQGHSHNHHTANEVSNPIQKAEIEKNIDYLNSRFKTKIQYYRFPNGLSTPYSLSVLKDLNIKPVSWFNGIMDSRTRKHFDLGVDGKVKKISDKFDLIKPDMIKGKIFLFHLGDNGDETQKYLIEFIEYCKINKLTISKL